MHAIRILVILLTVWNVAEHYARGVQPPDEETPRAHNSRKLLMVEEDPMMMNSKPTPQPQVRTKAEINGWLQKMLRNSKRTNDLEQMTPKSFAYSPNTSSYYYLEENQFRVNRPVVVERNIIQEQMDKLVMQRKTRQDAEENTALVTDELDELTSGFDSTARPRHTFIYETNGTALSDSLYSIAVLMGVIAAITASLVCLTYGLYVLSKRIRAPGDPEYPAYGVTGPSDPHGDGRLAHSAHLYHYQHQKQQIIAMESGGVPENRPTSISEPESDEENEEGDYTVYECPGFATTGDMEVKNPMFSDEPTPATPGKCEIVRPQPKE